jgi:hypothetical protein
MGFSAWLQYTRCDSLGYGLPKLITCNFKKLDFNGQEKIATKIQKKHVIVSTLDAKTV